MNKSELVEFLVNKQNPKNDRERRDLTQTMRVSVDIFFDSIMDALKRKDKVEIRGFGTFSLRHYEGYVGRNPRSSEILNIPPKYLPVFKPGKYLREYLNPGLKIDDNDSSDDD